MSEPEDSGPEPGTQEWFEEQVPLEANNPILVERVAQSSWEMFVGLMEKGFMPNQALYVMAVTMNDNPLMPPD